MKLWSPAPFGLTVATGAQRIARRVFRGRGDAFGYAGEYEGLSFSDAGDLPDLTTTPPQGRNPFKVLDANGALIRTDAG